MGVNVDRWTTYDALKQTVRRWARVHVGAAPALATRGLRQWSVDLSYGCPQPFERWVFARTAMPGALKQRKLSVSFAHPCRKRTCEACMTHRTAIWMARAAQEYRESARTWMVTLTMSPSEQALLDMKAAQGVTECVTLTEARCRVFGAEVRRWFRRLHGERPRRDTSYLAVAELHDSERTSAAMRGRPHFHVLLHEKKLGALIPDTDCEFVPGVAYGDGPPCQVYRVKDDGRVRQLWTRGFSKVVLCYSEQSAVYVCKYLNKSSEGETGRVKASPGYGALLDSSLGTASDLSCTARGVSPSNLLIASPNQGEKEC